MAWQRTAFLDQAYYLILAALLVALVAEQVSEPEAGAGRARRRDAARRRAGGTAGAAPSARASRSSR